MTTLKSFITLILMLLVNALNAYTLKGIIVDSEGDGMQSLIVIAVNSDDSSVVKFSITKSDGNFEINDLKKGNYYLSVTTGQQVKFLSEHFELIDDYNFPKIIVKKETTNLKEVEVIAHKPFIENKPGKTIVNVDALISGAGKNAFDILEQSPNITITQNNIFRIRGKQGVIFMIDGRITPMSAEDIVNYLKALPSDAIEKIEIITNASAKYDATGNAGMVNIILKKDKRFGTNGNINLSTGQGRYYKSANGFSVNNRNKKVNIYGSYNHSSRKGFNDLSLYRKFYANDTLQGAYDQFNGLIFPIRSDILRTSIDYSFSPRTIIGFSLNGSLTKFEPFGSNNTKVLNQFEQIVSGFSTTNHSKDIWGNYAANFNLKHTIDSVGSEISTDIDYASYGNKTEQNFTTNYFNTNGGKTQNTYLLYGEIKGGLQIRSIKADYSHPIDKDTKIETGIKSSYVSSDNNLKFNDMSDGLPVFDSTKSNHFIYAENINSVYLNFTRSIGKYSIQLGIRGEQTNVTGKQIMNGKTFKNSYIQIFPNFSVAKEFSKNYNAGISLSRRIDRPSYEQMNPFKFFLDPTTYKEGNPYLLPQLSYNAEFTQTFRQKIMATLGYSVTKRLITEVLVPAEHASNITVQTDVNLSRYDYYGISISAPLQPKGWWNSVNNMNVYYGYYRGNMAHTKLSNGSPAFDLNSNNNFVLKKNFNAELIIIYNSGQVYAYMKTIHSWQLSAGLQKMFNDRKGSIKLSVSDIFWTSIAAGESKFRDYDEVFFVHRDTRVVSLSLTYKLGKTTVTASRRRTGGAEEEKKRAGKGGN